LIGTGPVVTSGAVVETTLRCVGAPYSATVSDDEPTNVRSRSQCGVSLTNLRSVSG
jgi:hypothetical protein